MHKLRSVVIVLLGTHGYVSASATILSVGTARLGVSHETPILNIYQHGTARLGASHETPTDSHRYNEISPIADLLQYLRLSFPMIQLILLFVHDWVFNESYFDYEAYLERMHTTIAANNVFRDDDDDWDDGIDDDWDGVEESYTHTRW